MLTLVFGFRKHGSVERTVLARAKRDPKPSLEKWAVNSCSPGIPLWHHARGNDTFGAANVWLSVEPGHVLACKVACFLDVEACCAIGNCSVEPISVDQTRTPSLSNKCASARSNANPMG